MKYTALVIVRIGGICSQIGDFEDHQTKEEIQEQCAAYAMYHCLTAHNEPPIATLVEVYATKAEAKNAVIALAAKAELALENSYMMFDREQSEAHARKPALPFHQMPGVIGFSEN